jgi:hypothetical protein
VPGVSEGRSGTEIGGLWRRACVLIAGVTQRTPAAHDRRQHHELETLRPRELLAKKEAGMQFPVRLTLGTPEAPHRGIGLLEENSCRRRRTGRA